MGKRKSGDDSAAEPNAKPRKRFATTPELLDHWQRVLLATVDDASQAFDIRDWRSFGAGARERTETVKRRIAEDVSRRLGELREALKRRIQHFRNEIEWEVDYTGPNIRRVGHRQYDALIERMFEMTNRAISREALLDYFMNELDVLDPPSQALAAFVIERIETRNGPRFFGGKQRRIHRDRWRNYCRDWMPRFGKQTRRFIPRLFERQQAIELWRSDYVDDYAGEFDSLIDHRDKPFWIAAIPLPSANARVYPDRLLFILYPEIGQGQRQTPPSGAAQEWRCLHFLGMAYRGLEHQLRNAANLVREERSRLLTELAPGILHHEIGHQMNNIGEIAEQQARLAARLYRETGQKDAERLLFLVKILKDASRRTHDIAEAFNAMERRHADERFELGEVLRQIEYICGNRLGKLAIQLRYRGLKRQDVSLRSDPALLLHLLLNLVLNAISAFDGLRLNEAPKHGRVIQLRCLADDGKTADGWLRLAVENNGPAIPERIRERIFERGFTTRKGGHGQGLYICRVIAQYLGGGLELMEREALAKRMKVGFLIRIPRTIPKQLDLDSNR